MSKCKYVNAYSINTHFLFQRRSFHQVSCRDMPECRRELSRCTRTQHQGEGLLCRAPASQTCRHLKEEEEEVQTKLDFALGRTCERSASKKKKTTHIVMMSEVIMMIRCEAIKAFFFKHILFFNRSSTNVGGTGQSELI